MRQSGCMSGLFLECRVRMRLSISDLSRSGKNLHRLFQGCILEQVRIFKACIMAGPQQEVVYHRIKLPFKAKCCRKRSNADVTIRLQDKGTKLAQQCIRQLALAALDEAKLLGKVNKPESNLLTCVS